MDSFCTSKAVARQHVALDFGHIPMRAVELLSELSLVHTPGRSDECLRPYSKVRREAPFLADCLDCGRVETSSRAFARHFWTCGKGCGKLRMTLRWERVLSTNAHVLRPATLRHSWTRLA